IVEPRRRDLDRLGVGPAEAGVRAHDHGLRLGCVDEPEGDVGLAQRRPDLVEEVPVADRQPLPIPRIPHAQTIAPAALEASRYGGTHERGGSADAVRDRYYTSREHRPHDPSAAKTSGSALEDERAAAEDALALRAFGPDRAADRHQHQ